MSYFFFYVQWSSYSVSCVYELLKISAWTFPERSRSRSPASSSRRHRRSRSRSPPKKEKRRSSRHRSYSVSSHDGSSSDSSSSEDESYDSYSEGLSPQKERFSIFGYTIDHSYFIDEKRRSKKKQHKKHKSRKHKKSVSGHLLGLGLDYGLDGSNVSAQAQTRWWQRWRTTKCDHWQKGKLIEKNYNTVEPKVTDAVVDWCCRWQIKLKVKKSADDKERDQNRSTLLEFLNSAF